MDFDGFLRDIAPSLGLQWRPFQRRGIKRKIKRRMNELGLREFEDYARRIKTEGEEQRYLIKTLTVTISRFFRDEDVFKVIKQSLFPLLIQKKEREIKIWSIGCSSGEEPYSLALLWKESFEEDWPDILFRILATDVDEKMIQRAKEGRYKKSALKEVPPKILERYFKKENGHYRIDPGIKPYIEWRGHDLLHDDPFLGMDIILCRNLAFTYFSKESQIETLKKFSLSLKEKGYLVIGKDETLPLTYPTLFIPVSNKWKIYQKL
jgi:chemotaxis methyl-accepting protein methylase